MRVKMYKSGKNWVLAASMILAASMAIGLDQSQNLVSANETETSTTITDGLVKNANGQGYQYMVSGQADKNAWHDGYYFDSNGQAVNGWQDNINGHAYLFDNYQVVKSTEQTVNGKRYQFDGNGIAAVMNGLIKLSDADGYAYYNDGVRATNQFVTVDNNTYYFGQYGQSYNGLQTIGQDEYYFGDNFILQKSNSNLIINNVPYSVDDSGKLTAKNGILWGFGDSTTVGWNPYNDGSQSYDVYAAQDLQKLYKNKTAYSGTQIGKDMVWMTDQLTSDPSFTKATEIVIALGVNDVNYGGGKNLNTIAQIYQDSIRRIHEANPNVKIFLLLPQGDFANGMNNDAIGNDGFSINQLKSVLTQIGHDLGVTVIDAGVVTDANHAETIPDGVHPTNDTYKLIGQKIASTISQTNSQNYQANYQNYDLGNVSGYVNTLSGWRWLENGYVYTGFRYYMGTYYWFVRGVRQDSGWREAWGHLYYTDDNGRAVQGIVNINGQNFDFGNDGTYYMRSSGYLYDGSNANGGYRWYENGQLFTGFRYYMGTYYWFVDGVRQNAGWRSAWGMTYYTDDTGRALQGIQIIDGKVYNFGDDGTYYERPVSGYIWDGSSQNGGYRWYENGQLFTGFRFYMGTYYWFVDGVRQNAGWRHAWGYTYWTDNNGRAVQGDQMIDGHHYYFGNDGTFYLR
ncbi:GDSL-type esterase/lipase family protein [Fructobacillus papyrifericola]|uniref:SGNH hydrolase-type esterase domain-containing protein n=1 Tax=Fructobacillus papyrifericola TaxID=2713172 RepID=A0ABS5QRG2_9LACO|nr:GDSL-type esterase/lipase family protein [Fructobacillus papyrifericola]MBS9335778.1 hypothetical protein [Fructobacillus papyrifericola]